MIDNGRISVYDATIRKYGKEGAREIAKQNRAKQLEKQRNTAPVTE